MVWAGRWAGRRTSSASYGPDLMLAAVRASGRARAGRRFFYGGAEGVPERLAEQLTARFPGLSVAGTYSPPFRPLTAAEDADVVERINAAAPDLVWVGLSTPKQERWMAAHVGSAGRARAARRRRRVRHPRRHAPSGAALDAAVGPRVALPTGRRAPTAVARYLSNNPRFAVRLLAHPPRPIVGTGRGQETRVPSVERSVAVRAIADRSRVAGGPVACIAVCSSRSDGRSPTPSPVP